MVQTRKQLFDKPRNEPVLNRSLDINADGELNEEEFVKGCLDDDDLVNLLNAGGIDPEEEFD